MIFYNTFNVFVPHEKQFSWQKRIEDFIIDKEEEANTFAISVPRRFGKTHFAAHWLMSHDKDKKIYFNSSKSAASIIKNIYEKENNEKLVDFGKAILVNQNRKLTICSTNEELEKRLDTHYDYVIIDDADITDNETLHNAVIESSFKESKMIILGSHECDSCDEGLNKSVWLWLLNHPSVLVCKVKESSHIKKNNFNTLELLSPFDNILKESDFRVKSARA